MLSFRHGQTRACTCWALDTRRNLHLHTRLSKSYNTRKYTLSSWYGPTHAESSEALRHANSCSALDMGHHIKKLNQLSIDAKRCQTVNLRRISQQMHADTPSALDMFKRMQPHSLPSMCAWQCYMSGFQNAQTHADTRSALDTCRHMHTLAHTWYMQTKKQHTQPSTCADTCTYTLSSPGTCWHALSFWHRKLNEDASTLSSWGTCQLTLSSHVTCIQHILSSRHRKMNEDTACVFIEFPPVLTLLRAVRGMCDC